MTYEQWRVSYQNPEQAARAAFAMASEHFNVRAELTAELLDKDAAIDTARATLQLADEPDFDNPDPDDLPNLNQAISEALSTLDGAMRPRASHAPESPRNGLDHDYARKKLAILLRDVGNFNGDEFWREMSRIAGGATSRDHAEALEKQLAVANERAEGWHQAMLQTLGTEGEQDTVVKVVALIKQHKGHKQAEKAWEQTMMRLLGADGVKDAEREITTLQNRVSIVGRNMSRVVELVKAQQEWIDAVPEKTQLPAMPGFDRDWADDVLNSASETPEPLTDHPDFSRHQQGQDRFIAQLRDANRQRQAQIEQLTAQLLAARNAHYDAYWNNDDRVAAMEAALDCPPLLSLLASRDQESFRKGFWHGFERARMHPDEHNILSEWEAVKHLRGFTQEDA